METKAMRPSLLIMTAMVSCAAIVPAFALQADDTMRAWKSASDKDRSELLGELLGKDVAGSARISRCMNDTSTTPGHADLSIGDVAKACAASRDADQPV